MTDVQFMAVDNLNLTVQQGEVFGLLGPNGAGKTTTILMLLGLTDPTGGTVQVLGLDPARQPLSVKARVGYLPDQVGFYEGLTARENLSYIAKLNRLPHNQAKPRIANVLAQVGLGDVANKRVGTFSRGMRQRLGVAEVLLKQPQLIITDEPTLGLDPEAAYEFLDLIRQLKTEGITLLFYQVQPGFLDSALAQAHTELALTRLSPNTLYVESTVALLNPGVRSLGFVLPMQLQGAILGAPLPMSQSLLLIWPNLTGLIAATILLFAAGYVVFQRRYLA